MFQGIYRRLHYNLLKKRVLQHTSANLSHSAVLQTCRMASSCQVQLTIVIVEKLKIASKMTLR